MSILFFDPVSGERVTYADLLASVQGEEITYAPSLCPARPAEAVLGLLRAVVLGRALTLYDSDFSDEEIRALGGSSELFAVQERVPRSGLNDIPTMLAKARAGDGFRLTLFTSGSTGLPKHVTHRLEGLIRTLRVGDKHRTSVWGLAYNPTHIAGVQVILQAFFNGNPLIHLFGHDRAQVNRALLNRGITHLSATPSFYRLLLPVETPFSNVRAVTLGGERSDPALLARLARLFPNARMRNLYASTEAGTLLVADGEVFGIAGGLAELVIVRNDRLHVHRSLLGEFCDGRRMVEDVEQPANSQLSEWYDTGDVVEIVSEHPLRFRILARERDWVNVGGSKVNPQEVEAALGEHPAVRQVRVYGRDNSVMGSILVADVVFGKTDDENQEGEYSLTELALRGWLNERLQAHKIPRLIRFVNCIDQTRTGKISRR